MRNLPLPESFADLLLLAQRAACLNWSRGSETLSLILDDIPADRRTCLDVRLGRLAGEVRTLSGYDPVKNKWGAYCAPQGSFSLPDRKGLKALRDWLSARAIEQTGYPNPESFSLYRKAAQLAGS